jgi:integrase
MKAKQWGMSERIEKGLRIVQRGGEGGVWYREERVRVEKGIKIIRKSLETTDRKQAKQKAMAGMEAPARTFRRDITAAALNLEAALKEYREWFEKTHKASGALTSLPAVERFVDFVGAERDTREVSREHVQGFLDRMEGKSAIYVRNTFARVRAFLRRVERKHKDAVDLHVLLGVDLPKDTDVSSTVPNVEMVQTILRKLKGHSWLGDYVTCLLESGMRPGELLAVRGVDLRGNLLDIKPWGEWSPKSKWSKRTIQLTAEAARILEARKGRLFHQSWPIFCLPKGKMRTVKTVSHQYRLAIQEDGKAAGEFKDANLYAWRHIFCSMHAAPGPAFMDLAQLAGYIGHGPGSERTLMRWYVDRDALRRGAPVSLVGGTKEGKVVSMKSGG